MTSLLDFYAALAAFDWDYNSADDFTVWKRGGSEMERLREIAAESPAHTDLFDGFRLHHFAREERIWNRVIVVPPLPQLPQDQAAEAAML